MLTDQAKQQTGKRRSKELANRLSLMSCQAKRKPTLGSSKTLEVMVGDGINDAQHSREQTWEFQCELQGNMLESMTA